MKRAFFSLVLACGLLLGTGTAHAESGVVISTKQLSVKDGAALTAAIAKAKADDPTAFQRVAHVVAGVEKLDKNKRGRFATIAPHLAQLGKPALLPMLEMLAVRGPARGQLRDSAWITLRVGLIEAVGALRDPVAVPVLDTILDSERDYWVVRAAAEALGRIGQDGSADKLVKLARASGPKQKAVLAGIGDCRRLVVAKGLADVARTQADAELALLAVKALGGVGNSWAWKTPAVQKSGEEHEVRATAAAALVDAFVRFDDPQARLTARKAILLVDDPSTPALIEAAKRNASAATRAALDALAVKVANNPLRKY